MANLPELISVPIDPNTPVRVRRFMQTVADSLNSLFRSDQIHKAALGTYTISIRLATSSGLEITGEGSLRIDLNTTILNLTTSGLGFANQSGNKVLASPADGSNGPPDFRNLTANDIPSLSGSYQPLDGDLTAISALTGTSTIYYRGGSPPSNWLPVTIGANITFNAGVLDANSPPSGDPITSIYPAFTLGADDDEFDNGSFTGFTTVQNVSLPMTVTEQNNVLSIKLPGGDGAAELHAAMKARTVVNGSYVETGFSGMGPNQNFNIAGVIFADGTTYGSGTQVIFFYSANEGKWGMYKSTGYNTQTDSPVAVGCQFEAPAHTMFLRLVRSAANTWQGWISPDRISWINVTGDITETLTATHAGLFCTTYTGGSPFIWTFRYIKFG